MTIPQAIEKAVAGGWSWAYIGKGFPAEMPIQYINTRDAAQMLLNPAFWRAFNPKVNVRAQMHDLIDFIADGGTIESYFATL